MDFRELVKLLSQEFNTHIELRQIGVRDETAILGGIANCGRPLCCCQFLKDFASINVKMAKEQDLSLTPSTISGICGRLKCCLKYEHEGYLELEKTMPRRGELCECKEGRGRIVDRNLLTQKVTVQLGESNHTVVCPASEVSVVYLDKYTVHAGADESASAGQDATAASETPSAAPQNPRPQQNQRQDGAGGRQGGQRRQDRPNDDRRQQNGGNNRQQRPQRQNDDRRQNGGNRNNGGNRSRRPQQGQGGQQGNRPQQEQQGQEAIQLIHGPKRNGRLPCARPWSRWDG